MTGLKATIAGLVMLAVPLVATAQDVGELVYGKRTDWSSSSRVINFSMFAFNDVNRNGIHDLADRPMSAVAVAVARDGIGAGAAFTNANGFANFKAEAGDDEEPISQPGSYRFELIVPPGWKASTGNAGQTVEIVERPGSISGLAVVRMPAPVGLVQDLFVSGVAGAEAPVMLMSGTQTIATGVAGADGAFRLPVEEPGRYVVRVGEVERAVEIVSTPVALGTVAPRQAVAGGAPMVLSFDDLTTNGIFKIPSGYGDLNWFNLNALRRDFTPKSEGYVNGATSQPYVAYTSSGAYAEVYSDRPFDLHGMQLTIAWREAEGETAVIEVWRGETQVLRDEIEVSVLGPVSYQPRIGGVTRVRIGTAHDWQLVVDDLVVGRP